MTTSRRLTLLVLTLILASPLAARAESPAELYGNGEKLLQAGDFNGALAALAGAVRAEQSNRQYASKYMLVRRVIQLRERLDAETDPEQWHYLAGALRSFYVSEKIYPEALALDRAVHAKLHDAASAANLAETLLATGKNAEAAEVLAAIDPSEASAATQSLLGIALARQGKVEEAKKIASTVSLPSEAGAGAAYSAARLHAAVGDSAKALACLTVCFESIPPSRLDGFKAHARLCPEFSDLASTDGFAKALKTESKVAESKCSGGSKCAGCPMRGNCGKSQSP